MQTSNYIVIQCYGNEGVFLECAYALMSLSRFFFPENANDYQIWIYTDNPGWFEAFRGCDLPLNYRAMDDHIVKQWSGSINFVHRVKLELLKDFTQIRNGNVLYTDTDVVFTGHPDHIFDGIANGRLFMHLYEGLVSGNSSPLLRKLDHYLQGHVPLHVNGTPIQDLAMWNAGVLGFNTRFRYLLDDAITFTDSEYPKFPKHNIEQFACSVGFQQVDDVKSAAPYIIHYWGLKEARVVLSSFFKHYKNASWSDLVRYSSLIQMPALLQEKSNFYQNRTLIGKLLKKQWSPQEYNWKEMEKQC